MTLSRRQVLRAGALAAGAAAAGVLAREASAQGGPEPKRLAFMNLHTGESLDLEFSRGGIYIPAALRRIQVLLRDFRTGEEHSIDPDLLDILYDVASQLAVAPAFSVISGYRSPQTNAQLRERGSGVARSSLHMQGRAVDVRLAGIDCRELADGALRLGRGGVGFYRASDFVHLDTGAMRSWRG